ncbi:MAG: hypothetical protein WCT11_01695 [Candidatus Magasanikbacteria bacterium]
MDNPFEIKLAEICAKAVGDETSKKAALARCANFGLSNREEFLLNSIFGPTPDNVLILLDLYDTYLPYVRGQKDNGRFIADWDSANKLILDAINLDTVEMFGMFLRSIFVWNGEKKYESAVREVLRKFEDYTAGTLEFDEISVFWSEVYYKLILLIVAENLSFLTEEMQKFFINSKMLFEAIASGVDLDQKINQSINYFDYLDLRRELASTFAVFLYVNEQNIGFNPATGEPVKLAFWIDKFRVYSNKKFDGLSLINFIQDEKTWGEFNDGFSRMIINSVLMIYGHLVSGYYVYPPASEEVVRSAPVKKIEPETPTYGDIRKLVEEKTSQLTDDDKPTEIINLLNNFSVQYNDPTILDLYYFDEPSGEFKWRE